MIMASSARSLMLERSSDGSVRPARVPLMGRVVTERVVARYSRKSSGLTLIAACRPVAVGTSRYAPYHGDAASSIAPNNPRGEPRNPARMRCERFT